MKPIGGTACLAAFGLCTGCALPQRDNPSDPQNKPVAVLDVVTVEGGRATPFELNASGSYDPSRPEETLRFRWELHDPLHDDVGEDELDDFDDIPGNESVVFPTFPDAFAVQSSNGEGSILRNVRVKVIAADGAFSIAEGTIVVRNRRPILDPGEDLFIASDRTEPVILDALGGGMEPTSIDPEGDDVFYEWTQINGTTVTLDTSLDPVFKRRVRFVPPPSSPGRESLTFRLDATDGMSEESAFLRVHFGTQVWIASREPTRLIRSFPEFEARTELVDLMGTPVPFSGVTAIAVTSSGFIWTAEASGTDTVVRRLDSQFRQVSETTISGYAYPLWAEAEQESLCLVTQEFEFGGDSVFVRLDPLGVAQPPLAVDRAVRTHAAGPGECWVVGEQQVEIVDAAGNRTPMASGFVRLTRSTVGEQGALWLAEADPDAFFAPLRIVRLTEDGTSTDVYAFTPTPLDENQPTITDLAPRRGGGLWIHNALRELLFLSPEGEMTVTDAPRIRLHANSRYPLRQLVSDPSDGTLWLPDSQSGDLVHLLDAGDSVRELGRMPIESVAPGAPFFVSPHVTKGGGIAAAAEGADPWLFRIPTHMKSRETVEAGLLTTFPASISGDTLRGAVWISDGATFEQRILRTSHSGRHLASIPVNGDYVKATSDGGLWATYFADSLPSLLRAAPDGEILESVTVDGYVLRELDAIDDRACAILYAPDPAVTGLVFERGRVTPTFSLELPSGAGEVSACWIDRSDGAAWFHTRSESCEFFIPSGNGTLRRVEAGDVTPSLVVTSHGGQALGCAFSGERDGGVWVETSTGEMVHWTGNGASGETIGKAGRVTPCPGGEGGDACREVWRLDEEVGVLHRYASDGTPIRSYSAPGPVVSFDVIP